MFTDPKVGTISEIVPPLTSNDNAAMNQLLAFINQVEAMMKPKLKGKKPPPKGKKSKLTPAEGQPLIDAATAIVDGILAGS